MIDKVLNKAEAAELFGEEAGEFFDRCIGSEYLTLGRDYSGLGVLCESGRELVHQKFEKMV